MTEDKWLLVDEIRDFLGGLRRETVYRRIANREMPVHKIGRSWRFKRDEVGDWGRAGGATEPKSRD